MADKYASFGKQRRNKLWEGSRMILPEHRARMLEIELHQESFTPRPDLDEEKLAEMSQVIAEAIGRRRTVTLTLYREYGPERMTMLPQAIDQMTRTLKGRSALGDRKVAIAIGDIIDVEVAAEINHG